MSQLINEIKQDLHGVKNPKPKKEEKKSMTLMEMVFNNDMNPQEIDNPGYDTGAGGPEPEVAPQQPQQPGRGNDIQPIQGTLPSEAVMDPEVKGMLDDIRVAVIKALGKLANRAESLEYSTMKKILQIIDKPVESQDKQK